MMLIATKSTYIDVDGTRYKLRRGITTAAERAAVVDDHPDLWEPLVPDFPAVEAGESAPGGRPPVAANKAAWSAYVASLGGETEGLSKDDLIDLADRLEG